MFTFIRYEPTIDKLLGTECEQIPSCRSGANEGNIPADITLPRNAYSYASKAKQSKAIPITDRGGL
jgi:hypothetical protein